MDIQQAAPFTGCTTKVGAAVGTTTTLTTTATALFAIRSKAYTKAAASNAATPTTDANTGVAFVPVPINYGCVFLLCYDASNALKVAQGQLQALDTSGNFIIAPQFAGLPDAVAAFSYLVVKVGAAGAAWTFGTSNLAGPPTGVVFAFQDLIGSLPDRPQVA